MATTQTQTRRRGFAIPGRHEPRVADVMHPGIVRCDPETSVTDLARLMADHHVHCVLVMGFVHEWSMESLAWGMVTDVDLVRAGVSGGSATARELAHQPVPTVEPWVAVRDAMEVMLDRGVAHLVVVQPGTHRPIGMLSSADVVAALAQAPRAL